MGITSSSQLPPPGEGHHPLFYKGVKALSEGRYTYSEAYFQQAIKRHPGRAFWDGLVTAAIPQPGQRRHAAESESASSVAGGKPKFPTVLLPVDNHFLELHDFARLISDIALNYYYKAVALGTHVEADMVRRVGMMYSGYLAVRVQVAMYMLHVMLGECIEAKKAAEGTAPEPEWSENEALVPPAANFSTSQCTYEFEMEVFANEEASTSSSEYKGQFDALNPPPQALLIKVLSLKEECIIMWASSVISYAQAALQSAALLPTTAEGEAQRKLIMNMAWRCCDSLLITIKNVARVYKSLTTAALFESFLVEMRDVMVNAGHVVDTKAEIDDNATQHVKSVAETKVLSNTVAHFLMVSDISGQQTDGRTFLNAARNMNLGVAPVLPIMSIVPARFEVDLTCNLNTKLPRTLHPTHRSVFHYIDWFLRDVNAEPMQVGNSEHFLKLNSVTVPLSVSDYRAFTVVMGEEVFLMSYPVMFLEATLFRLVNCTEEMPKLARKATELALTTYGGDSPMCFHLNTLFKRFLGHSM